MKTRLRRQRSRRILVASAAGAILSIAMVSPRAHAAEITSWFLGTAVQDFSGQNTAEDEAFSFDVTNPFTAIHDTFLPPAEFAITNFEFAWNEAADLGSFEIDFDQGLTLGSHVAGASGNIFLTSTVPLLLDLDALMNFTSSPGDEASFLLKLSIRDVTNAQTVFSDLQLGGNGHFGQPASGTLAFSADDILLPAGPTYRFLYNFRSSSPTVGLNGPMLADGFIKLVLHPRPRTHRRRLALPRPADGPSPSTTQSPALTQRALPWLENVLVHVCSS